MSRGPDRAAETLDAVPARHVLVHAHGEDEGALRTAVRVAPHAVQELPPGARTRHKPDL